MTIDELADYIKRDLCASYALPFLPPDDEIKRIIEFETKIIYRLYREALTETYYVIDLHHFNTKEFKTTRSIQLPSCVEGISKCCEINNGSRIWGFNDPDMRFDRAMASDMYLSPMSGDQITYRTIQWSFWDLSRTFILNDIQFSYNFNTHRLFIKGRDPKRAVYLLAKTKIPEYELYEDPMVINWMVAKSKISLGKILGAFNYTLLGGVTTNANQWADEGRNEIKEIEKYFETCNPVDWMLMC